MTAEMPPALVGSCPHHCSTAGTQPSTKGAAVGPQLFCSCTKAWQAGARQGGLPLAPEQDLSTPAPSWGWAQGAAGTGQLPGKAAPGALASAVLCPPKLRAAWSSISWNASLDYPLLLDSPDRRKKIALSLLWSIWIQEYLVPAKSQISCGNTHKWQGKDNSLSAKFLYLHRNVPREKAESSNLNKKRNCSRRSAQLCEHQPRAMAGWEHVLARALLRHFTAYWGFPTMQKYSVNCFQSFCLPILNWNRGFGSKNVSYMKQLR